MTSFYQLFKKKDLIYLFLERGEGREKERERHPCPGYCVSHCPATQRTVDLSVRRPVLSPLSHTSQGLPMNSKGKIYGCVYEGRIPPT